jgi:hypothetical protein
MIHIFNNFVFNIFFFAYKFVLAWFLKQFNHSLLVRNWTKLVKLSSNNIKWYIDAVYSYLRRIRLSINKIVFLFSIIISLKLFGRVKLSHMLDIFNTCSLLKVCVKNVFSIKSEKFFISKSIKIYGVFAVLVSTNLLKKTIFGLNSIEFWSS